MHHINSAGSYLPLIHMEDLLWILIGSSLAIQPKADGSSMMNFKVPAGF